MVVYGDVYHQVQKVPTLFVLINDDTHNMALTDDHDMENQEEALGCVPTYPWSVFSEANDWLQHV